MQIVLFMQSVLQCWWIVPDYLEHESRRLHGNKCIWESSLLSGSVWSTRDETGSPSFFSVLILFIRFENNWDKPGSKVKLYGWSIVRTLCCAPSIWICVFNWSLKARGSLFLPSAKVSAWCDCTELEEPESNGVHLKPSEHAHYLQPKTRLI